jgi:uncharacterized membrane protein YphA (DoxX/SURF4 family)
MTLLRAASRTLLASYFVVSGVKAVRDPELLVPVAQPLADKLVPLAKQYAPQQVSDSIPEDAVTLVRVNGALQLAGGLALATGRGRRLGAGLLAASLIPSTLAKHPFWDRTTEEEREIDKAHFLKNLSLLGGVLIAAGDTEGRPSLAYRAHAGTQLLARDTRKAGKRVAKSTRAISDAAVAEGAMLVGAAVATTRKARRLAAKELKRANKKATAAQIKAQRSTSRAEARAAKVTAARAAKDANASARTRAKEEAKEAAKAEKLAKVAAAAEVKQAQKQARKREKAEHRFARNVQRGEN